MPDKSKTTKIDKLYSLFRLRRVHAPGAAHERIVVDYLGDLEELRRDNFITEVSVAAEVDYLAEEVQINAAKYLASLNPKLTKLVTPLTTACAKCEYRACGDDVRSGFRACWGSMADVKPHILELYFANDIGSSNGVTADELISRRKVSLLDIPEESLLKKDGSVGERNKRQRIQVLHTKRNTEWVNPSLGKLLRSFKYPLKFIDFETSQLAVPYHAGMRPYEQVAFQWSCHSIEEPGAPPVHKEWINVVDAFPNFDFARSLMEAIGTDGTTFMYATHENTILSAIMRQMTQRRHRDPELARWLETVSEKGWLVDMNQLTLKNYFHPLMKGKTSIKKVVDAIWKTNPELRTRYPEYLCVENGGILSPYQSLPPLKIQGEEVVIADGTGAMRAYEAMLYGLEKDDPTIRKQWKQLLLQYCKLDTLAMVMLWQHWSAKAI